MPMKQLQLPGMEIEEEPEEEDYFFLFVHPENIALVYDVWGTVEMRWDDERGEWIDMTRDEAMAYRGTHRTKDVPIHLPRKGKPATQKARVSG
jgi:hypothetical protein